MSATVCPKAFCRLLLLAAALCLAVASPVLAAEAPGLVHSVEIVCHPDQSRAMAAMREGMVNLPRELSGQMRLMDLDGIWCLRLGEAADEASLRPALAAVQTKYPQAALVLGQVGRGRVAARVARRTPGDAGRTEQAQATPQPQTPALALASTAQDQPYEQPSVQPFVQPVALALSETRPFPPVALASRIETEVPPRRLARGNDTAQTGASHPYYPAKVAAPVETPQAKAMEAAAAKTVPAPVLPAAQAANAPWPAWAWLAAVLAVVVPAAAGYWLGRRRQGHAPVILPHLRDNGPLTL